MIKARSQDIVLLLGFSGAEFTPLSWAYWLHEARTFLQGRIYREAHFPPLQLEGPT